MGFGDQTEARLRETSLQTVARFEAERRSYRSLFCMKCIIFVYKNAKSIK